MSELGSVAAVVVAVVILWLLIVVDETVGDWTEGEEERERDERAAARTALRVVRDLDEREGR